MAPAGDEHHEGHDDDFGDWGDEAPRGAPPSRDDRLWVHPAELTGTPRPKPRRRLAWVAPLSTGVLGAVAAVSVLGMAGAFDDNSEPKDAPAAAASTVAEENAPQEAAALVAPSLVVLTVRDDKGARRAAGVCVRRNGDILTSARFVDGVQSAEVTTADGTTTGARVLATDTATDIALLSVGEALEAPPMANEKPRPGDPVWLVGPPVKEDAEPWMSSGVVTADDALVADEPGPTIGGLLQTDASYSAQASGGALVDSDGKLTGIVLGPVGDNGVTYAMPIANAMQIARALRTDGHVPHGSLGLVGIDTAQGPTVTEVAGGGSAAKAGLQPGDVILIVAGRPVIDMAEVTATVRTYAPGRTVEIEVQRGDDRLNYDVMLTEKTAEAAD
ncbi:MAG TPA: S1C family serine protease [Acidimicrobiia bacterium]|nr:S1C family serine protease [Acidimicrobiia bacterium]